jgi:hypothetical protein
MHIKTPFICQQVITQFQKLKLLTPEAFHFDEILLAKLCSETKRKRHFKFPGGIQLYTQNISTGEINKRADGVFVEAAA